MSATISETAQIPETARVSEAGPAGAADTCACSAPASGPALDAQAAERVAVSLKALADPMRLRIVTHIAASPGSTACVCDLVALSELSQPTVSHHLRVLRTAGVLRSERHGTWVWYSLEPGMDSAVGSLLAAFAPEHD